MRSDSSSQLTEFDFDRIVKPIIQRPVVRRRAFSYEDINSSVRIGAFRAFFPLDGNSKCGVQVACVVASEQTHAHRRIGCTNT